MLIILYGENSFFSKRKLDEIIAQYKAKHKSALSFFVFDESSDISDIKAAHDTMSLFEEKKLIVLKNILISEQCALLHTFLDDKNAKEDKDTVVVLYENKLINSKKNKDIAWFFDAPTMIQESKKLLSSDLINWVIHEASQYGGNITYGDANFLISRCGDDMWRLSNEIAKLVSYNKDITKQNIALLISENDTTANVFYGIDALIAGDTVKSARHFYVLLQKGERWDKMMGAIVFKFRKMLLASGSGERNASLRGIYMHLLKIDVALKTGGITFENALWSLQMELKKST